MFAGLVRRYAAGHALEPLLAEHDGCLDFFHCFEQVTRGWEGGIELLHVDMPETYAQLREAVRRTYALFAIRPLVGRSCSRKLNQCDEKHRSPTPKHAATAGHLAVRTRRNFLSLVEPPELGVEHGGERDPGRVRNEKQRGRALDAPEERFVHHDGDEQQHDLGERGANHAAAEENE